MILFLDSCVRKNSRTRKLAKVLLEKLGKYETLNLPLMNLQPLDEQTLEKRNSYIASGDYSSPIFDLAKQFAAADTIVIAAPYWDGSFPSVLKVYIENIFAIGIVSCYSSDGTPKGLCKAKNLYYVTTSGGSCDPDFGYQYISKLAKDCFGIKNTTLIKAQMLDVQGFDADEIMHEAEDVIKKMHI